MIEICNLKTQKPKEPFDVKVDRSTILGNPFVMHDESERQRVCDDFEIYFKDKVSAIGQNAIKQEVERLIAIYTKYGRLRLFCWCHPRNCHARTIKLYILERIQHANTQQ